MNVGIRCWGGWPDGEDSRFQDTGECGDGGGLALGLVSAGRRRGDGAGARGGP